jgi:uncharacterized protein YcfL
MSLYYIYIKVTNKKITNTNKMKNITFLLIATMLFVACSSEVVQEEVTTQDTTEVVIDTTELEVDSTQVEVAE